MGKPSDSSCHSTFCFLASLTVALIRSNIRHHEVHWNFRCYFRRYTFTVLSLAAPEPEPQEKRQSACHVTQSQLELEPP